MRVVTYDRRGFGQSGQSWEGFDYDTFASDLQTVMETLDLKDATLVGFSMGGGEVVRYLSRYGSERVANAVLISAVTPFLSKTPDNPDGIDPQTFDEIESSIRKDRFAFIEEFGPKLFGRTMINHTVSDAVLSWIQAMALTSSPRATLAAAKAWFTTDFRNEMERITVPVRVIHGTGDATVPIENSGRRTVTLLPNAELSEYEGEPHGLFFTAAEKLNAELLEFIRGEVRAAGVASPANLTYLV